MYLRLSLVTIVLVHSVCAQVSDRALLKLLRAHQETLLSETHPEGLGTIISEGTAKKVGGSKQTIKIIRKFPDKIRTEAVQNNGIEVVVGFNGKKGWGRIETDKKVHFIKQESQGPINWLQIEAQFENHLLRALKGDKTIKLKHLPNYSMPDSDLVLHVIEATDSSDVRIKYFINATTYSIDRKQLEAEGCPIMEIRYGQYRKVEGFLLAHNTELYEAGDLVSHESYHTIRVNEYLFDFMFSKPGF
jgi:hypothetical protein